MRRFWTELPPPDDTEPLNPGLCQSRSAGESSIPGVCPRYARRLHTVHIDHVVRERFGVGVVGPYGLIHCQSTARSETKPRNAKTINAGMTIGGTNQTFMSFVLRCGS